MGLGLLTRAQIITQGLLIGGNPSLNTIPSGFTEAPAVTFFKTFLHGIYLHYDLPFNLVYTTVTTGSGANTWKIDVSGVSRFRASKLLKLDNISPPLEFFQDFPRLQAMIWALQDVTPVPGGTPSRWAIDVANARIILHPIPSIVYTGKFFYYKMPDVSADSDNSIVAFEDTNALINAVAMFARDYDKDSLVSLSASIAEKLFGQYRAAVEDTRSAVVTPVLDANLYRYRRGD